MESITPRLLRLLACPAGHGSLTVAGHWLRCYAGCAFPIVDGVPVMLRGDLPQTIDLAWASLRQAESHARGEAPSSSLDEPPLWAGSLGLSDEQRQQVLAALHDDQAVDPAIAYLVAATNGIAYLDAVGRLASVPIPALRMPPGEGRTLLDIGCSWGRWVVAAARLGYRPIGIDPSLGAIMAARRLTRSLGIEADFVVGDARMLPFGTASLDTTYSYSVVQHLSYTDAAQAIAEMGRVLVPGGQSLVQMPNALGIRSLQHQARRHFRAPRGFEVRYWTLPRLLALFREQIGETRWSVDCFFGLGLQATDLQYMTPLARAATRMSEVLRGLAVHVKPLGWVADSLYFDAVKADR